MSSKVEAVGDNVILAFSEALKAAVRETTHLGGRVANSTAAALVNFLFLPGYTYFTKARYDLPDFSALTPARISDFLSDTLKEVSFLKQAEDSAKEVKEVDETESKETQVVPHFSRLGAHPLVFKRFLASLLLRLISFRSFFISTTKHQETEISKVSGRGAKILHHLARSHAVKGLSRSGTMAIRQNAGLLEDITDSFIFKIDAATTWLRDKYGCMFKTSSMKGWPLLALFETAPTMPDPSSLVLQKSSSHTASVIDRVCGYPVQCIDVETLDGYLIRLIRIPHKTSRRVVFFQHGLLDSSAAWVSNGHIFSLGLRAFQEGYDVFLGNLRGTRDTSLQPPPKATREPQRQRSRSIGAVSSGSEPNMRTRQRSHGDAARHKHARRLRRVRGKSAEKKEEVLDASGFRRMHKRLNLKDKEFWSYSVDDHVMDMMALIAKVHEIKESEKRYWRGTTAITPGATSTPAASASAGSSDRGRVRNWSDLLRAKSHSPPASAAAGSDPQARTEPSHGSSTSSGRGPLSHDGTHYSSVTVEEEDDPNSYILTAAGHSMGGAILLFYLLHMRAFGLPHRVSKALFLSPAGYHEDIVPVLRYPLMVINKVLRYSSDGPFPAYNSTLQRMIAKLLEDVKRSPAATDLLASFASTVLGGEPQNFVFRHVDFVEYPIGGTSRRVIQQGVQVMNDRQTQTFDHGRKENRKRFGSDKACSYRQYYSLYDVPMHFVAGGKDSLIPPSNLRKQNQWINEAAPGISTLREFDVLGHMDFTLGVDDDVISHVLNEIRSTHYSPNANRVSAFSNGGIRTAEQSAVKYPFLNTYYFREEVFKGVNAVLEGLALHRGKK